MTRSETIMRLIQAAGPKLPGLDYTNINVVVGNLKFLYQLMVASEDLLETAIAASKDHPKLLAFYTKHLAEERDHAKWLAEDLAAVGLDVKTMTRSYIAEELAGAQYYAIKHIHPRCLLGFFAVMEGSPPTIALVEALENEYGPELFRTLRYHAVADQGHSKELFHLIDELDDPEGHIATTALFAASKLNEFAITLMQRISNANV